MFIQDNPDLTVPEPEKCVNIEVPHVDACVHTYAHFYATSTHVSTTCLSACLLDVCTKVYTAAGPTKLEADGLTRARHIAGQAVTQR